MYTLILILVLGYEGCAAYNYDYMQPSCTEDINLWEKAYPYGMVQSTRSGYYKVPTDCRKILHAPPGYQILARIRKLRIYRYPSCTVDALGFYNNDTWLGGFCGSSSSELDHDFVATSGDLVVRFFSQRQGNNYYSGFSVTYTIFHKGSCNSSNEFQCSRYSRCIPAELTCDGINNCGDYSDEGTYTCGLSGGSIAAIIISVVVFLVAVAACVGCCFMDKKRSRNSPRQTRIRASRRVRQNHGERHLNGERPPDLLTSLPSGHGYLDNPAYTVGPYEAPPAYCAEYGPGIQAPEAQFMSPPSYEFAISQAPDPAMNPLYSGLAGAAVVSTVDELAPPTQPDTISGTDGTTQQPFIVTGVTQDHSSDITITADQPATTHVVSDGANGTGQVQSGDNDTQGEAAAEVDAQGASNAAVNPRPGNVSTPVTPEATNPENSNDKSRDSTETGTTKEVNSNAYQSGIDNSTAANTDTNLQGASQSLTAKEHQNNTVHGNNTRENADSSITGINR